MTPLFTVHAGEYIVGEKIEKEFKELNVWIPSKDTGIDLLITNKENTDTVSLQVKLSRVYMSPEAIWRQIRKSWNSVMTTLKYMQR